MTDLLEGGKRGASDALGRGVGRYPVGVCAFEVFEFAVKRIIIGIADCGTGLHIVEAVVTTDFVPEELEATKRHGILGGIKVQIRISG